MTIIRRANKQAGHLTSQPLPSLRQDPVLLSVSPSDFTYLAVSVWKDTDGLIIPLSCNYLFFPSHSIFNPSPSLSVDTPDEKGEASGTFLCNSECNRIPALCENLQMSVWLTEILVLEKNSGWKRRGRKRGKTQRLGRRVCALAASEVNATQLKQKTKSLSKCLDV